MVENEHSVNTHFWHRARSVTPRTHGNDVWRNESHFTWQMSTRTDREKAKAQNELHTQILNNMLQLPENKTCAECGAKGLLPHLHANAHTLTHLL